MKRIGIVLACLLAVFVIGCEDNNGGGGSSGVTGTWKGTGGYDPGTSIDDFTLVLTQDGNAVSGSYDITRPNRHMVGSVSGTIEGNALDMTLNPNGLADGTVDGNVMTLHWWESGYAGEAAGRDGHVTLTRQ